jgi:hypothetical protein
VLLGCLSNSPVDAAQQPTVSEREPADHQGAETSSSTGRQTGPQPPALPVFQTEVLVTAGAAPRRATRPPAPPQC